MNGFFDTPGGEITFLLTLLTGYGVGKMIELLIKFFKIEKSQ